METKKSSLFVASLTYAAIIAGIMAVYFIVMDLTNLSFSRFDRITGQILPLIGVGFAIYAYRKEFNNNFISYGKALGFGVLTATLFGLIYSVFSYAYISFVNPDLQVIAQQVAEESMLEKGMSAEEIEAGMEFASRFQKPPLNIIMGTLSYAFYGTIFSLIASAFLKKESKNPFEGVE